ncbi:hypothetical protein ACFWY6_07120 [Streptomyces sp. NPDC059037]|uniref:hypothetical protein n=1 Tax=Streptomyces sp. NPDC059037 TaxID=3346710 RepID=UPI00369DA23C
MLPLPLGPGQEQEAGGVVGGAEVFDQAADLVGQRFGVVDDQQPGLSGVQDTPVGPGPCGVVGEVGPQVPGDPAVVAQQGGQPAGETGLALPARTGQHPYREGLRLLAVAPVAEIGELGVAITEGDGFDVGLQQHRRGTQVSFLSRGSQQRRGLDGLQDGLPAAVPVQQRTEAGFGQQVTGADRGQPGPMGRPAVPAQDPDQQVP